MSVTPSSAIVGVFTERANAEQALDALYNAGFTHEQVHYSGSETSGGFLDDLKSLFTGQNTSGNVANNLADLGLSNEEVNYYANEHNNGNFILAVKAPGRGSEVQSILQQYGSLNAPLQTNTPQEYTSHTTTEPAFTSDDTITRTTQPTSTDASYQSHPQTVPSEHETDNQEIQPTATNFNDEGQPVEQPVATYDSTEQQHAQSFTDQDTPPITHDNIADAHMEQAYDSQEDHPVVTNGSLPQNTSSTTSSYDEAAPSSDTQQQFQAHTSEVQPTAYTSTDTHATYDAQPTTTEHASTDPHATSDAMIDSETASNATDEPQVAQDNYTQESEAAGIPDIQTAQPVATTTDYTSQMHDPQLLDTQEAASNVPTEPLTTNSTTTDEPVATTATAEQSATGTTDTTTNATDDLQSLQAQIASLQQQLQDAKAQLQAAKEREEQVRSAREREQQLQTLRQQIQALQAELTATNSELQETQSRLGGY